MLAALASPPPEEESLAKTSSESDLGDDVVTLSYERALRAHARYVPADKNDWPLTREAQIGVGISQDESVLPAATRDGIRLSEAECARLHKHAAEAGVTVSAYLRSCTFEAEALRAEVKTALAELRATMSKVNSSVPTKERRTFWGGWHLDGWRGFFRGGIQRAAPSE